MKLLPVLDLLEMKLYWIAAGIGEPGLTIAAMLKRERVFITDMSEEMLMMSCM